MAKPFKNLVTKMSPLSRTRVHKKTTKLLKEMALKDLREKRRVTQEDLAEVLEINQSSISKLENRGLGISVAVLRKYIEALGGELELRAKFPDTTLPFSISKTEEERNDPSRQ